MYTILLVILSVILLYCLKKYFVGTRYSGPKPDLAGKYAIVTGGAGGIGKEVVWDLAWQGCRVVIADVLDASNLAN